MIGRKNIMESVYSTLFLDNWKLRNFLRLVRNEANRKCLSRYVLSSDTFAGASASGAIAYFA